jgi:orotate phosphoribosyltransferase
VLIDREQGGAENLRHHGYELLPIVSLRAMLTFYVNTARIGEELYHRCMDYLERNRP